MGGETRTVLRHAMQHGGIGATRRGDDAFLLPLQLAEKSGKAAREIGKLINETINRVNEGSLLSDQVKHAFGRIERSVGNTTESIARIHEAASAQAQASRDVGELLAQLSATAERY